MAAVSGSALAESIAKLKAANPNGGYDSIAPLPPTQYDNLTGQSVYNATSGTITTPSGGSLYIGANARPPVANNKVVAATPTTGILPQSVQANFKAKNAIPTNTANAQAYAASSVPSTYTPTNYSNIANQAAQQANAQGLGSMTDLAGVYERINQAANLMNNATFQDSNYLSKATQDIMATMDPVLRQQNALTSQQYDNSGRALAESLALSGLNRGGVSANKLMFLEQARNNQMSTNQANMMDKAMQQAVQQGQMALTERGQLQQQAQAAAAQLANLLNAQESSRQWATTTNLDTQQNNFANALATARAQAEESQFGANYAQRAREIEQALGIAQMQDATQRYSSDNSLAGTQYAPDNSLEGSKYSANAGIQGAQISAGASTANAQLAAQTAANALAAQIAQQEAQTALQAGQLTGTYNGQQTLGAQELAANLQQQQLANAMAEAGLTGTYNGQDTINKQMLLSQQQQQELANALATAGVTGTYNGQQTIQAQQLAQQQAQAEIANQLAYASLMSGLAGSYFNNAEDIARPEFAFDWLEDWNGNLPWA